jgi:hypothetical protein
LGSRDIFYEALGQTFDLKVAKRKVGISSGLREESDWISWLGRRPPK